MTHLFGSGSLTDLRDDLEELRVALSNLLQHGGEHVGVLLDDRPDLLEHLVIPAHIAIHFKPEKDSKYRMSTF